MIFPPMEEWTSITIPSTKTVPERVHVFERESVLAVRTAMAARRPLLVRGEPGVGKSQLAEAVALKLKRPFVSFVVDSRTESRDLLFEFDAVMRLADAQLLGALGHTGQLVPEKFADDNEGEDTKQQARLAHVRDWLGGELSVERYIRPGPLWWAFDWQEAEEQATLARSDVRKPQEGTGPENGCVVLIDEIDKGESDVPNGLLEALGNSKFAVNGRQNPVEAKGEPPLVIITSNEERSLPPAFLRRCLTLDLELPEKEQDLIAHLQDRGMAHFPELKDEKEMFESAARQLIADRSEAAAKQTRPLPGQAEYLDLIRALSEVGSTAEERLKLVKDLSQYTLKKNSHGRPVGA